MTTTRVNLTIDDIVAAASEGGEDDSYGTKIPILKRRAAAAAKNKTCTGTVVVNKDPICVIVVGMAGSGKTTLMSQLQKSLNLRREDKDDDVSFFHRL